jgi:hypothetical protein
MSLRFLLALGYQRPGRGNDVAQLREIDRSPYGRQLVRVIRDDFFTDKPIQQLAEFTALTSEARIPISTFHPSPGHDDIVGRLACVEGGVPSTSR